MKKISVAVIMGVSAMVLTGTAVAADAWRKPTADELKLLKLPLGLDKDLALVPVDNPITQEKIELGRALYFDTRLSDNNTIACATCHSPRTGYTDGQPVSMGIGTQKGGRSAPTVINRLFSKAQFWDGRTPSLEGQAIGPITNPIEMGMPAHANVVSKLNQIKGYRDWFQKVYKTDVTLDGIAKAIATFERTVVSGNSAFDRYEDGDQKAMSASAINGMKLFRDKARCNQCHTGFNFSDEKFHNLGVAWPSGNVDVGLYGVTGKTEDIGKFKTPSLRGITETGPYMHNGSLATLQQVVEFYNKGGEKNPFLDSQMSPLNLTAQEVDDVVEFMKALEGEGWKDKVAPASFPR